MSPEVLVFLRLLLSFIFIWVRITFCRFRYDLLIISAWKVLLPLVLNIFVVYLFISYY
jgi:NADH:ubiquinone oxidoreductase subunit H